MNLWLRTLLAFKSLPPSLKFYTTLNSLCFFTSRERKLLQFGFKFGEGDNSCFKVSESDMSEVKLFGKMIQLTRNDIVSDVPRGVHLVDNASVSPDSHENKKQRNAAIDSTEEEEEERKAEKILPCPRCESNDTKFCYFNNYNLNQPRYFCKACQRYWTAGGAIRNVPVGSGRRKTNQNPEAEQQTSNFNCFPAPPWYPAPIWSTPLGKHSREGELIKSKTLIIDDPSEVAKSSIWATLGIKNEKVDLIGSVGAFGGFRSKVREMNSVGDGSLALYANPAAFSRSLRFHESAE